MAYRELELTLLSAQELKSVNLFSRMDVYAVVSISGDPLTRQCTAPDTSGGRNPRWNATFRFAVPPSAAAAAGASLHVLLRAERFLGDRDVGEVVVPLSDILAGPTPVAPQPPKVASYQVRKLHRWEPRGVLNVSYRLGPVVAPVVERAPTSKAAPTVYAPPGEPPQPPSRQHPSTAAYPATPAPGPPAVRVPDEAAHKSSSSPVMAYSVGVPVPQQASSYPPAKQDAYRPPTPPRPAAVHAEEARRAPTPPPTNTRSNGHGLGEPGPTHVYQKTQIIVSSAPTTAVGPPTMSIISPRSRKEDRWRPSPLSQSQHDTQQQQQQQKAASSPVAAAPSPHRQAAPSPFSSRSSSFSSPSSPYSSAHPSPSPSSAHSSARSPYSYSAHPSAATSPHHPPLRSPAVGDAAEVTHGTNDAFRSTSSRGSAASSPLLSSSPTVPNHSRRSAVSSPLPSSSPMAPKHSSVVP